MDGTFYYTVCPWRNPAACIQHCYHVHKNVNMYFTDAFGRGAVIKPHDIGENSMQVQAPIYSRAATRELPVAGITDVLFNTGRQLMQPRP